MSANDAKERILQPPAIIQPPKDIIDFDGIEARIRLAAGAATRDGRNAAREHLVRDCAQLLSLIRVMVGELVPARTRIRELVTANNDLGVVSAVLMHEAGGEVRVDRAWFAEFDPKGGFTVTEDGDQVVIRAVDAPPGERVASVSAEQQTEDASGEG